MKNLIYVLEDDKDVARIISRTLKSHGFAIEEFHALAEFNRAIEDKHPDIALIDLGLPDGDGLSVVADVLRRKCIASIIVTGRGNLTDRVVGLELGADDYIVKPFEARELLARVRALMRRLKTPCGGVALKTDRHVADFAGWVADFPACTLTGADGQSVELSAAETELLRIFVDAAGRVLSRSQLLDVQKSEIEPFDRSIDARVSRLRRKLRDNVQSPKIIRTVYGAGYVFAADVKWRER